MKKMVLLFFGLILVFVFGNPVSARGTQDEAKALVEKASAYYKAKQYS